jgi:hypothetical protein
MLIIIIYFLFGNQEARGGAYLDMTINESPLDMTTTEI